MSHRCGHASGLPVTLQIYRQTHKNITGFSRSQNAYANHSPRACCTSQSGLRLGMTPSIVISRAFRTGLPHSFPPARHSIPPGCSLHSATHALLLATPPGNAKRVAQVHPRSALEGAALPQRLGFPALDDFMPRRSVWKPGKALKKLLDAPLLFGFNGVK